MEFHPGFWPIADEADLARLNVLTGLKRPPQVALEVAELALTCNPASEAPARDGLPRCCADRQAPHNNA